MLTVEAIDDRTGPSPIWHARETAWRLGLNLAQMSAYPYRSAFFGTPMYHVDALAQGTAAALNEAKNELEECFGLGCAVTLTPVTETASGQRETYQPLRGVLHHRGSDCYKVFTD